MERERGGILVDLVLQALELVQQLVALAAVRRLGELVRKSAVAWRPSNSPRFWMKRSLRAMWTARGCITTARRSLLRRHASLFDIEGNSLRTFSFACRYSAWRAVRLTMLCLVNAISDCACAWLMPFEAATHDGQK